MIAPIYVIIMLACSNLMWQLGPFVETPDAKVFVERTFFQAIAVLVYHFLMKEDLE